MREQAERVVDVRNEQLVTHEGAVACVVAAQLDAPPEPLAEAFAGAHSDSVGRYHAELTAEEIAEVEAEAGRLLAELGYR